jgi:hypothetical protein
MIITSIAGFVKAEKPSVAIPAILFSDVVLAAVMTFFIYELNCVVVGGCKVLAWYKVITWILPMVLVTITMLFAFSQKNLQPTPRTLSI